MKNFKHFIILFVFLAGSLALFAQATKPTIMVVPSKNWCEEHGYMQQYDNQGKVAYAPDYSAAFVGSIELKLAISKINEMMVERGFPLKRLESALEKVENQSARDAMMTGKSGAKIAESPIDKLNKVAKADILMELSWSIEPSASPGKKRLVFILDGIDAYTGEGIAQSSGPSSDAFTIDVPVMLEQAVLGHIDNFNSQLMSHFEDMAENGREIVVTIKTWDDFEDGLEAEYDDEELGDIIKMWMKKNTVKGRFKSNASTENEMSFEGVRIPLFEEIDGETYAVEPDGWLKKLSKYLKKKYQIQSKVVPLGLGEVQLVIGGK